MTIDEWAIFVTLIGALVVAIIGLVKSISDKKQLKIENEKLKEEQKQTKEMKKQTKVKKKGEGHLESMSKSIGEIDKTLKKGTGITRKKKLELRGYKKDPNIPYLDILVKFRIFDEGDCIYIKLINDTYATASSVHISYKVFIDTKKITDGEKPVEDDLPNGSSDIVILYIDSTWDHLRLIVEWFDSYHQKYPRKFVLEKKDLEKWAKEDFFELES